MRHNLLLTLSAAALCTVSAFAVPARQGLRVVTQPDGSTLTVRIVGDERSHRVYTADGHLLVADADDTYTYAVVGDEGFPVSSGVVASDTPTAHVAAFAAGLDRNAITQAFDRLDNSRPARISPVRRNTPTRSEEKRNVGRFDENFPVTGSPKGLVVLVSYSDVDFSIDDPHDYFERMLNEEGFADLGATGSVSDWFKFNSNGLFTPDFDLYGPVQLPNKRTFYGANDAYGGDRRPEQMAIQACQLLDDEVDFSEYDTDGDGYIDNIFIFYAGMGEADGGSASTVWPHSAFVTEMTSGVYKFDGVILDRYACSSELATDENDESVTLLDGIGTFVHEFSHVMGLPDLYSTAYTGAFTPGTWSVLDMGPYNNNGRTPPNYSAYERYALGWLEPEVLDSWGERTLKPVQVSNHAFIIPTDYEDEFFILENRQWLDNDLYLPWHGMLVWHIDFNKKIWIGNMVNNYPSHQYVDLIEADNIQEPGNRDGDSFPGLAGVTRISPETVPCLTDWNKKILDVTIDDITETEDGLITFKRWSSGVESIAGDAARGHVWSAGGAIYTDSAEAAVVYDLTGRQIGKVDASSPLRPQAQGLYLVRMAGETHKLMVR